MASPNRNVQPRDMRQGMHYDLGEPEAVQPASMRKPTGPRGHNWGEPNEPGLTHDATVPDRAMQNLRIASRLASPVPQQSGRGESPATDGRHQRVRPAVLPTSIVNQGALALAGASRDPLSAVQKAAKAVKLIHRKPHVDAQTEAIFEWLKSREFLRKDRHQFFRLKNVYGHKEESSRLFESGDVLMAQDLPWLKKDDIKNIRSFCISRAHAEITDYHAVSHPFSRALKKFVDANYDPACKISLSISKSTRPPTELCVLRAPHLQTIYFDPSHTFDQGAQGALFAGLTTRGREVAIKRVKLSTQRTALPEGQRMRQADIDGPLAVCDRGDYSFIAMRMRSGTLESLFEHGLKSYSKKDYRECSQALRHILYETLKPINDLHLNASVIHNDIKPQNFLINVDKRQIVLTDYGCARDARGNQLTGIGGRTNQYAAPESLRSNKSTPSSDIFGVALSLIHMAIKYCAPIRERIYQQFQKIEPGDLEYHGVLGSLESDKNLDVTASVLYGAYIREVLRVQVEEILPKQSRHSLARDRLFAKTGADELDQEEMAHIERFHAVHRVFAAIDPALESLLCMMAHPSFKNRPTAQKALLRLREMMDADEKPFDVDAVWRYVPRVSQSIQKAIENLRPHVVAIRNSQRESIS